jgi:hypothetical protein
MESRAHFRRVAREGDTNQHIDSVEGAELSVPLYSMGQLEELEVPTSGGNAEQSKQLKQLVDKWCCENEPIITSLRNTFESGGSGAERLEHVVASFSMPMQQQRDIDPEGAVAQYDYSKLMAGTGTDFHSELLNFKEKISRLPKGVRADPAYWINRIKEKMSDGQLAAFDCELKSEEKSGKWGRPTRSRSRVDHLQQGDVESNRYSEGTQRKISYRAAVHSIWPCSAWHGDWGAPAAGRTPASMRPVRWIQMSARKRCQQPVWCVCIQRITQHHAKEILDDPPLKAFIDRVRKRYGKALINYPQPTEVQKQKLESYDAYRETLFAAKGKGGKGGSAQAGRPPAANAHSAPSTEVEQQLDEGLAWLEEMRGEFGVATTE